MSFLTPYCASHWSHGPHMDHNPEIYYLSVESPKKWTLIFDSLQCFDFFFFMVIFCNFGPLEGALGAPRYSWGPPQGPFEKLDLDSNPHLVSGATASSIGQIHRFLGSAIVTYDLIKKMQLPTCKICIRKYITSKRIELESPCWSGFEALSICFKT